MTVELARYPSLETLRGEMAEAGFTHSWTETTKQPYPLADIQGYRERAYSALHLITDDAFQRGIARLERDLRDGPIVALSLYTLVWGE